MLLHRHGGTLRRAGAVAPVCTARGEVVRVGKATAIVDVHVYDSDDVMVARGKCYFQLPSTWRDREGSAGTK